MLGVRVGPDTPQHSSRGAQRCLQTRDRVRRCARRRRRGRCAPGRTIRVPQVVQQFRPAPGMDAHGVLQFIRVGRVVGFVPPPEGIGQARSLVGGHGACHVQQPAKDVVPTGTPSPIFRWAGLDQDVRRRLQQLGVPASRRSVNERSAARHRAGVQATSETPGGRPGPNPRRRRPDASDVAAKKLRGWDSNPQTFRLTADCSAS